MKLDKELLTYVIVVALMGFLLIFLLKVDAQEVQTVDPETAVLAWDPPTEGGPVEGYTLLCGTTSRVYTIEQEVGNTLSCPVSSLTLDQGTIYYVVVKAYNDAGAGPASNEVVFRPLAIPGAAVLRME